MNQNKIPENRIQKNQAGVEKQEIQKPKRYRIQIDKRH